jgi:hypothetical protein
MDVGGPPTPEPESPYVPGVYRLDGTDDATREQLNAALRAGALAGAQLSVLYEAGSSGYESDAIDLKDHPILLAKTNLSTTSQPGVTAPLRLLELGEESKLGPVAARLDDVPGFAQLLWELSVVQAGGFYLRYADAAGEELPASIFKEMGGVEPGEEQTGDSAELTLAITFPDGPLQSWHNGFVIEPPASPESLYLKLADESGTPLQALHPTYPPGCVGFEGTWARATELLAEEAGGELYEEDWIAQLYHLLQFQVSGPKGGSVPFEPSLWSLALSPIEGKNGEGSGDSPSDYYQQVLPAFRFVEGKSGEPSPYDAVGGDVQLTFRAGDVFGNVLGDYTYQGSLPVLYNDPLVGPGEWPGVKVGHRFLLDEKQGPLLRLALEFDRETVVRTDSEVQTSAVEQAEAALLRYAIAIAQLRDPDTKLSLEASLLPPGAVGDPAALKQGLLDFALEIQGVLAEVVEEKAPRTLQPKLLDSTISPQRLADCEADLVAVEVKLGLSRSENVYVGPEGKPVEKSDANVFAVPADLAPPGEADSTANVTLIPYAEDFEAAFAGWGGSGSAARLAVRSDQEDVSAPVGTSPLWALRTSAEEGVEVSFAKGQAAYFSLAPLDVKLWNGEAQVPTYDEKLKPTSALQTFTGIDLDQWGEGFLAAMDEVLSPAIGTALAAAQPGIYDELMRAKSVLAEALAQGVVPVFAEAGGQVVEGNEESAREVFEQSVLAQLSSAFGTAAIVQVPATVAAHGTEKGTLAPRLFGSLSTGSKEEGDSASRASLGTAKLTLEDAPSNSGYLTFLVSVAEPGLSTSVKLSPTWDARFVEHLLEEDPEYGYRPSEWLRVARQLEHDPLAFELGKLEVPVPSRHYPPLPVLEGQSAAQSPEAGKQASLAEYLFWDYGAKLELPGLEAQDMLCLEVDYNRPLEAPNLKVMEVPSLPEALASFTVAWPALRPHLQSLSEKAGDELTTTAIERFWEQAKTVTRAWALKFGLPDPWPGGHLASPQPPMQPPAERTDLYTLDFGDAFGAEKITVYARAPEAGSPGGESILWPRVNGEEPLAGTVEPCSPPQSSCAVEAESGQWSKAEYKFAPPQAGPAKLELEWQKLDVLGLQTACSGCWRTRNAELVARRTTNEAFVYRTPKVEFPNPVVPTIVTPKIGPLEPGATAALTLAAALAPLATAGSGVSEHRLIKLSCGYEYSLPPVGGESIRVTDQILLADQVVLLPEGTKGKGVSLTELCEEVASNCEVWFHHYQPQTREATLVLAVVLFAAVAEAQLPVIQVPDLQLKVDEKWWGP